VIVSDTVSAYLAESRRPPDPVLAEMEEHAARERIPIVVPETGQLLHVLTLARAPRRVLEVGTAIGVSTLYIARALAPDAVIVSFEIDEVRQESARQYLERAAVLDRTDLRLEDARGGLASLQAPFEMAFIDGVKAQYGEYLELVLPLLADGALLVVDNVLMAGTVARGRSDGHWSDEQIATARRFNERVLSLEQFESAITPVGDGVLVAVRR
jgi:predicted O-methyltransferase YrrM